MTAIFEVIIQNILPIFLVAALGFWLRRSKQLDPRPLASVVFNAFSPALVFTSLVNSRLPTAELGQLAFFTVASIVLMGVIGLLAGRALRLSRRDTVVLLLVLMFVNGGNYGLTLNHLRYGNTGLARAVVYYTVSTIMLYTVGVIIVSMGRCSWRESLKRLLRVPAVYAVALAIIVYHLNIQVPHPLMRALDLASAGAIPAMIVVLGMNLAQLSGFAKLRVTIPAVSLRLLIGPVIALFTASWIGLYGINRSTAIIEASMPTAVMTTVLATEFDVQPAVVTSIVVLSTVLSPITLAVYISLFTL